MIFVVVKVTIRPEHSDQWLTLVDEFTQATRREPGKPVLRVVPQCPQPPPVRAGRGVRIAGSRRRARQLRALPDGDGVDAGRDRADSGHRQRGGSAGRVVPDGRAVATRGRLAGTERPAGAAVISTRSTSRSPRTSPVSCSQTEATEAANGTLIHATGRRSDTPYAGVTDSSPWWGSGGYI